MDPPERLNPATGLSMRSHAALPSRYVGEGKLLKEVSNMCHCRDSTTDFVDEFESLPSPDTGRFDSHRHEVST